MFHKAIGPYNDIGPRVCARLGDPSECRDLPLALRIWNFPDLARRPAPWLRGLRVRAQVRLGLTCPTHKDCETWWGTTVGDPQSR